VTAKPPELGDSESSTIVRTHLAVQVTPDLTISGLGLAFAFGMTLVSDQAAAVGATAIASPATDDADWFVFYQGFTQPYGFANEYGSQTVHRVDSKAMRRALGENKTLAFVISNKTTTALEFFVQTRILYKLA